MAFAGEAGELTAELKWMTAEESASVMTADPEAARRIRSQRADVMIYLVRPPSVLDVDLVKAAHVKIDQNEVRYPREA